MMTKLNKNDEIIEMITVFCWEPLNFGLFFSGAMIFVVVDDIIPEAQTAGNGR